MNNFMYAMEHSYSAMKTEIDRILKKSDYTTEDENRIFYVVEMYLQHLDGKDVVSTCGKFIEQLKQFSI